MKAILSVLITLMLWQAANAQVPVLNSYPQAPATIYLDFDGQYVAGTIWNFSGPIDAAPASLSAAAITEIFNRVAEDYRIFNINVTTDSAVFMAAPLRQRIRIIITPTYEWYGKFGGISYVGSFVWGDNTPAWVCNTLLWNNPKKIAEAASHEAGHTLGLQHQSTYNADGSLAADYNPGKGTGQIAWAPIMGDGNSKNITTWYNGSNSFGKDYLQDDISIIAGSSNGFGLRADDLADDRPGASPLAMNGYLFQASGLINSATDKDVFRFSLPVTTNFQLSAIPENVGVNNAGANVDIRVTLQDAAGNTIGQYNPADLLDAGVDSNLNAGDYYLVVEGVPNVNMNDYGSVGFFLLSGSLYSALPVRELQLTGETAGTQHQLHWHIVTDESLLQAELQVSDDGTHFRTLSQVSAEGSYSWQPEMNGTLYYRLKVQTVKQAQPEYSSILHLKSHAAARPLIYGRLVQQEIHLWLPEAMNYQLIGSAGQVLATGRMSAGTQHLPVNNAAGGLLILRLQQGSSVFIEKLIKQ